MCRDTRDQAGCMTGVPPRTIHSALAASQDTLTRSVVYNRLFYVISGIIVEDFLKKKIACSGFRLKKILSRDITRVLVRLGHYQSAS
jgi:hypothetical protein